MWEFFSEWKIPWALAWNQQQIVNVSSDEQVSVEFLITYCISNFHRQSDCLSDAFWSKIEE